MGAFVEQLVYVAGLRLVDSPALAGGFEEVIECDDQLLLDFHVAHPAGAIAFLEVLYLGLVRIEGVVIAKHRVALDRAGDVGADAVGVGVHAEHPPAHHGRVVAEEDGVVQALAHLGLAVGAHQRAAHHVRIGQREDLAVGVVETAGDLAGEFDVALVVFAHRHQMRPRHENVGGLQYRIAQQVVRDLIEAGRVGHVLDRRQLLQPLDGHQSAEQQLQFVDLVHGRLQIEGHLGRVDADGQMVQHDGPRVVGDGQNIVLGVLGRQHVQVGDQEKALVLVLQRQPVPVAADVVAQMEFARGAVAG